MKNISIAFVAMFFWAAAARAQGGEVRFSLKYAAAFPTGSLKEQISNASFRGFGGSLMVGINDKISVGLDVSHQDFFQRYPRQLYKLADGSDVSAVLGNSIQTLPILLRGQYNFLPQGSWQPYLALGLGGSFNNFQQDLGEFSSSSNKFGLAVRPEAGLFIPFGAGSHTGFSLGAGYDYLPYNYLGIKQLSHIEVNAGISFPLR